MAQKQMKPDKLCCSVCLGLLKDPVTLPCGHSFCLSCVNKQWDEEDWVGLYSCSQCTQTFSPRPAVVKNVLLAELVEVMKNTGSLTVAGTGRKDVTCDFCMGEKQTAVKFCLQCLVYYCEEHLQPHYGSDAFGKHKLVNTSERFQETYGSHHSECTTKNGDPGLASAVYDIFRKSTDHQLEEKENELMLLQQEEQAINVFADEAVANSEKILAELIPVIRKKYAEVKTHIRSKQRSELSRVRKLQRKLKQEVDKLTSKTSELQLLQHKRELTQKTLNDSAALSMTNEYFEDVSVAVSEVRNKVQDLLRDNLAQFIQPKAYPNGLLPLAEPKTRNEFLEYACVTTLNENTADSWITIPSRQKAKRWDGNRFASHHPDMFTDFPQILCRESLTGRCYWEVEFSANEGFIAVVYKDISRSGDESVFGNNDKSWALECFHNGYEFRHNKIRTPVSGPVSSRVGVYLDHSAGVLSFLSVSGSDVTPLHRIQTIFTQPLCPGVALFGNGIIATFCIIGKP
ncbi:tripartite motif-containing protein 16-like [Gouania willdenowi]|uniref:Tripartite motif-containing protein 16-like n=1 Tax=Gouania willdenowi TaxID=441366 RepID=A0A8C5N7M2_GOUWI|nr:tripartite motif-containing protein 16-like [Gouania willdenowi]